MPFPVVEGTGRAFDGNAVDKTRKNNIDKTRKIPYIYVNPEKRRGARRRAAPPYRLREGIAP